MPVVCPKISNIDSQRMIICVVNTKGGKDRDLPLSQAMLETLRAYWHWLKPGTYLFPSRMSLRKCSSLRAARPMAAVSAPCIPRSQAGRPSGRNGRYFSRRRRCR
jgi:integrase